MVGRKRGDIPKSLVRGQDRFTGRTHSVSSSAIAIKESTWGISVSTAERMCQVPMGLP